MESLVTEGAERLWRDLVLLSDTLWVYHRLRERPSLSVLLESLQFLVRAEEAQLETWQARKIVEHWTDGSVDDSSSPPSGSGPGAAAGAPDAHAPGDAGGENDVHATAEDAEAAQHSDVLRVVFQSVLQDAVQLPLWAYKVAVTVGRSSARFGAGNSAPLTGNASAAGGFLTADVMRAARALLEWGGPASLVSWRNAMLHVLRCEGVRGLFRAGLPNFFVGFTRNFESLEHEVAHASGRAALLFSRSEDNFARLEGGPGNADDAALVPGEAGRQEQHRRRLTATHRLPSAGDLYDSREAPEKRAARHSSWLSRLSAEGKPLFSRLWQAVLLYPFEVLAVNMVTSSAPEMANVFTAARHIYKTHGFFKGFFPGLRTTMVMAALPAGLGVYLLGVGETIRYNRMLYKTPAHVSGSGLGASLAMVMSMINSEVGIASLFTYAKMMLWQLPVSAAAHALVKIVVHLFFGQSQMRIREARRRERILEAYYAHHATMRHSSRMSADSSSTETSPSSQMSELSPPPPPLKDGNPPAVSPMRLTPPSSDDDDDDSDIEPTGQGR